MMMLVDVEDMSWRDVREMASGALKNHFSEVKSCCYLLVSLLKFVLADFSLTAVCHDTTTELQA